MCPPASRRHAHPSGGRRPKRACAAARPATSTFSSRSSRIRVPARRADLYCASPISMVRAALGGEFTVRTLDGGDAQVRIPEGGNRPSDAAARQGPCRVAVDGIRDLYIRRARDAAELTRRQRELLADSSRIVEQDPTGEQRLLRQDEEFFEGLSYTWPRRRSKASPRRVDPAALRRRTPKRNSMQPSPSFAQTRPWLPGPRTRRAIADQAHPQDPVRPTASGPAASASGRFLARAMALRSTRRVTEVSNSARTGPVTQRWSSMGSTAEGWCWSSTIRLLRLLAQRFRGARVVQADAYDLPKSWPRSPAGQSPRSSRACRCSTSRCRDASSDRGRLRADGPQGVMVQFT